MQNVDRSAASPPSDVGAEDINDTVHHRIGGEFRTGRLVFHFPTSDEDEASFFPKGGCQCSVPVCVCGPSCGCLADHQTDNREPHSSSVELNT